MLLQSDLRCQEVDRTTMLLITVYRSHMPGRPGFWLPYVACITGLVSIVFVTLIAK